MNNIVIVFINSNDSNSKILGKALYTLLNRKYYIFSREATEFPTCKIENTLAKIKEVATQTKADNMVVCFGVRLLPGNLSQVEGIIKAQDNDNLVFLKKLKGSKTWSYEGDKLTFDNYRIADTGIFVLKSSDLVKTNEVNFNAYIRKLAITNILKPIFVNWWIFSNSKKGNKYAK